MSNAPTPSSTIEIYDGSPPKGKRRLSDASDDSVGGAKAKKLIGADGKIVKDGSNKTKSGRFKPGAPVDLDEQCGVITDKNVACSRSLTCKTHGVGSKRLVNGRSKPFDQLLLDFQKRKEVRMKAKAEREKDTDKQSKKAGQGTGSISTGFADGGDIAVPQAGTSGGHSSSSFQVPSPSSLSSIAVPSLPDDIQVQTPSQAFLQGLLPHQQPAPRYSPNQSLNLPSMSSIQGTSGDTSSQPPTSNVPELASKGTLPAGPSSAPNSKGKATAAQAGASGPQGSNSTPSKAGAAASGQSGAPTSNKKKKVDGAKTGKAKASARNKADLILGEVDDPPEPTNAASNTLVGADGNFIVEEEAPDSDDEVDQLMLAISHSRPRPLALATHPPFERTPAKLAKYRESFLTAFTGRSMSSTAV